MRGDRDFDLILWGATGFTGQLVAGYLQEHYGDGSLRWAVGGRDQAKLTALRRRLGAPRLEIVLGDAADAEAMAAMAKRTRVVCTTVGPYARYGTALLAACAAGGTHYCDLTAELPWIRRMIDEHHERARASGARIVPTCGIDSIPSDLGVYFLQREMRSRYGAPSPRMKGRVAAFKGGASGGTIASILNIMEEVGADRSVRRLMAHPYCINPEGSRRGPEARDLRSPAYDAEFERWTAPFLMAPVNTRVVRRSAALLPDVYGPEFRYDESMLTGKGPAGALRAVLATAAMAAAFGAIAIGPIRRLAARRLRQPGEGPMPEQQENGYWEFRFLAEAPDVAGAVPLRARLRGDRDPGYGSTSKMLAESAVSLALDTLDVGGGFHTPASALGQTLIARLQERAGVTFEVNG